MRVIVLTGKRRALKRTEEELKKGALYNTAVDGVLSLCKQRGRIALQYVQEIHNHTAVPYVIFQIIHQAESIKASGFLCTAKAILSLQKSDLR